MRMTPFMAILRHELRTLLASWLVRLWLVGTIVLTLLLLAGAWPNAQTALLIPGLLFPYLFFPWGLVVMILGVNPVTGSRLEALADGILSRPITRYEYLFASWAARVVVVLAVFLVVMVPVVCLAVFAERPVPDDTVTLYGVVSTLGIVGLVLTSFVSLGFMMGTVLRRPLLSAVILVFVWILSNLILHTFSLEEFSTISLNQALPTLLRTSWSAEDDEASEDNVNLEDAEAVRRQAARALSILSGGSGQAAAPAEKGFYEQADYEDFSLLRVILGYGLLTLSAIGLATAFFCWRDL
jgi:ABC-type transport system involved in multi-copper enzyme maturation permease subunit